MLGTACHSGSEAHVSLGGEELTGSYTPRWNVTGKPHSQELGRAASLPLPIGLGGTGTGVETGQQSC